MSDRKNRDLGKKKEHQKYKSLCNCWLCIPSKEKKRILREREIRNEKPIETT